MSGLSTPTIVLIGVACGVYAMKAAAPMFLGGRPLPKVLDKIASVAPAALVAAMVVSSTIAAKKDLVLDARLPGVIVACVAQWRKAGFVTTVLLAIATTALVRFGFPKIGLGSSW
jgi:branched-subunit amino acid transport protein